MWASQISNRFFFFFLSPSLSCAVLGHAQTRSLGLLSLLTGLMWPPGPRSALGKCDMVVPGET